MTALRDMIAAQIRATGPMGLAEYMDLCLLHPEHGYYATRDPFGQAGDFVTAPEISQMFGELLGLFIAQCWLDQGSPAGVLAEIGPGRGTLMADALRGLRVAPGAGALKVHLIEASAHLHKVQSARLPGAVHLDRAEDLPQAPLFLIANEFFDALPIRQFQRVADGWAERMIGLEGDALSFGLGPVMEGPAAPEGEVLERCPAAAPVMAAICDRIRAHGGAALIVDYGGWNGRGDTLQALRKHAFADPLAGPGQADLTAHVDFAALARPAIEAGLAVGYTTQGALLSALGIKARAARLTEAGDGGARAAMERLTAPDQMGQLFKALAIWPRDAAPPPGFKPLREDEIVA